MTNPLQASYYADSSRQYTVEITCHDQLAADTWRVRFSCPEIARRIVPGQFLMVRLHGRNDPLIGRPLAVYDLLPDRHQPLAAIDLVYQVRGKFTQQLASLPPGQTLDVWGPLGNGFPILDCQHLIMVAGGVGQTPFLILAKEHVGAQQYGIPPRHAPVVDTITLCYGAASADRLAGVEDFRRLNVDVRLSTDDGSIGTPGQVTEQLAHVLDEAAVADAPVQIVCCGPHAMMRKTAQMAADRQLPCWVSLETPMACGIGICFTCVARIRDANGQPDYKRTCVEGPVFDATRVDW